jgi:Ca-activated chloride channel family protein
MGLKYNLLTQYTSFVAVREKVSNATGDAQNVEQPLPLPMGVSDLAVGSEPEFVWLVVIALFLAGMAFTMKRWRMYRGQTA